MLNQDSIKQNANDYKSFPSKVVGYYLMSFHYGSIEWAKSAYSMLQFIAPPIP